MTGPTTSAPSVLEPGDVLGGRYVLTAPIAAGGMGDVWQATDDVLGRDVAVKVMRADGVDDDAFTARFRDEARNAAGLHHPHIASVFDYGEQDERAWIVMELVPGQTVADLVRERGALPADEVRRILGQSALALAAAHAAGVVHRDVKPSNIIVTPDGRAKLTDFGISRADDSDGHTLVGEVLGTPDYLSPEQALGHDATGASDLYALGVVAHELLTGTKPFDRGAPVATARAHVIDEPPPLPDAVPDDLRELVAACLLKDPQRRPADAHAVGLALLGVPALDHSGMPSAALDEVAALPPAAEHTRPLPSPVLAPANGGGPTDRATRHTSAERARPDRRRIALVAAAAAVVIGGGAMALGAAVDDGSSSAARPAATTPAAAPATTPAPSSPAASPTSATSTTSTTSTTKSSTRAVASAAPAQVAPAPPPSAQKAGKGKGHGKGKGNGR